MQDCHDSTSKEFLLLLYPLPGEAGESDFRSPPTSVSIGCLVAGVIKAPPPSLWDHSEAISGSAGASEEGPRCILGFVVHLQHCSLRVGPRHTGNYNPQQPGEEQREVGARITWELGLGGLVLGAAAAAAQRTGAFCLERRRGPGSARPAACPCLLGPGRPSRGWGPPLGPGLALGAAAPPLARPARPEGRNRPGLPARPRAISGVAATALRAPDQRLPLAPQADAMKIKDAKKPCKMGVWVRRVGRAHQAASGKPLAGRPASKRVAPAGTARGMGAEGCFQHPVPGSLPIPLSSAGESLPPPWPFLALPPELWEVQAGIFVSGFGRQD